MCVCHKYIMCGCVLHVCMCGLFFYDSFLLFSSFNELSFHIVFFPIFLFIFIHSVLNNTIKSYFSYFPKYEMLLCVSWNSIHKTRMKELNEVFDKLVLKLNFYLQSLNTEDYDWIQNTFKKNFHRYSFEIRRR